MIPAKKSIWLTTAEIAGRFGLNVQTVRSWISHGVTTPRGVVRLRAVRIGYHWRVKRRWLREYLAAIEESQNPLPPPPPVEPVDRKQKRFAEEKRRLQERLDRRRKK